MTSGSLNLPEDRTPSVLNREKIWITVKRASYLIPDTGGDQPLYEQTFDEKLSDEVGPF